MRISMAVLALCVVGCDSGSPMTEEQFVEEYFGAACDAMFECYGADLMAASGYGANSDACVPILKAEAGISGDTGELYCVDFDADMASTCVDEFKSLTCDELEDGEIPNACYLVCT